MPIRRARCGRCQAKSADNTLCIIEHFGNADAVPQPPERCLSRKAGIVRCCLSKTSQKSNANFVAGYALNLCKFHIYHVPYNHNIAEEGMEMTQNRVRKERTFGFQRISRSSALMITWQAGKVILPSQRFIRKQT